MEGSALISEIIEILTGGIVGVSSAVGTGLSTLARDIFFATGEGATGLSVLGTCIVVFAGISLAELLGKYKSVKFGEFWNENTEPNYQISYRLIAV